MRELAELVFDAETLHIGAFEGEAIFDIEGITVSIPHEDMVSLNDLVS